MGEQRTVSQNNSESSSKVDLDIIGMTCASCANRIEKGLNKIPGVSASVNFALERATVQYQENQVTVADLISKVESIGYKANIHNSENKQQEDKNKPPFNVWQTAFRVYSFRLWSSLRSAFSFYGILQ